MNKKSLIINILLVILEIVGLYMSYYYHNRIAIEYYTVLSNILVLITSLVFSIYLIKKLNIPTWLKILKHTATTSIALTFLVVIFILAPMYNFNYNYMLFYQELILHHLICPILSIITFIFFDNIKIEKNNIKYGISFTLIYAFIIIILNILKIVIGPYPFLMVYNQPIYMSIIWFILIVGLSYLISIILIRKKEIK